MKNKLKKGFTLTELIIVVVIIAILAAVLIPTYTGMVNKAKDSNDTSLVKMLNDAMMDSEFHDEYKHDTFYDVVDSLEDYGFKLAALQAKSSKNVLVWNQVTNRFYILNNETYAIDTRDSNPNPDEYEYKDGFLTSYKYTFWVIYNSDNKVVSINETDGVKEIDSEYSVYLAADIEGTISTNKGVDVGDNSNITSIAYSNNETTSTCQDVVIRSNSFNTKVTINGKAGDASTGDTVKHYGYAYYVDVQSVADASYDEYGTVGRLKIATGHVEAMDGCEIFCLMEVGGDATIDTTVETGAIVHEQTTELNAANGITKASDGVANGLVNVCSEHSIANMAKLLTDDKYVYYVCKTCGYTLRADGSAATGDASTDVQHIGEADGDSKPSTTCSYNHADPESFSATTEDNTTTYVCKGCGFTYSITVETPIAEYEITATKSGEADLNMSFVEFRNSVNNGNHYNGWMITLNKDIDLSTVTEWTPIGSSSTNYFGGSFNGNYHTISNMSITSAAKGLGLFGFVKNDTDNTIIFSNLTFDHTTINIVNGGDSVGTLIGFIEDDSKAVKITNVTSGKLSDLNTDATTKSVINAARHVGGIVGKAYAKDKITIENCQNYVALTAHGTVGSGSSNGMIGGIVGYITCSCEITNCSNFATITQTGANSTGGILGAFSCDGTIKFSNCSNSGNVTTNGEWIGGMLGYASSKSSLIFDRCSNTGDITNTMENKGCAGGIWGGTDCGTVSVEFKTSATNTGTITASNFASNFIGSDYGYDKDWTNPSYGSNSNVKDEHTVGNQVTLEEAIACIKHDGVSFTLAEDGKLHATKTAKYWTIGSTTNIQVDSLESSD